eukprot:2239563-Alexandrium_andersonii.AAC.1
MFRARRWRSRGSRRRRRLAGAGRCSAPSLTTSRRRWAICWSAGQRPSRARRRPQTTASWPRTTSSRPCRTASARTASRRPRP